MHFEGRSMLLQQAIVLLDKGWVGEQGQRALWERWVTLWRD